ncbi:Tyrosine-specific transport protein [Chlamydiales bacterium SCGC AG-110-P3]|nr:Tyrosine-specific transport protein [Chlamydiales bacterium SCGC AG-110-P3]
MTVEGTGKGSLVSAMFLVAGCCIGGGMLALPVATGVLGLMPSMLIMGLCWAAMTATGLLLVEASLWFEEGAHVITMVTRLLGPIARGVAWILYLYIGYASLVAYTASGGDYIASTVTCAGGISVSKGLACTLFALVFGSILYLGNTLVGRINTILFIGMIGAYALLVTVGIPEVQGELLRYQRWSGATLAFPLMLTAFSFQTIVPSLTPYLDRNVRKLRVAVAGGTTIAFGVYLLWEVLILGIVPVEGSNGLAAALEQGQAATHFLSAAAESPWVAQVATFFAFFALVTSFLAIAMGLFDFLSDGLKIPRRGKGELTLATMILLPTLYFAVFYERAFIVALDTSGGLGDTVLNGIFPVMMVWAGRYSYFNHSVPGLRGGRPLLILLAAFYLFAFLQEVLVLTGGIQLIYDLTGTSDF